MICHKHKCIFIHIPKTAGTSIYSLFTDVNQLDWRIPNYEIMFGWCPQRKIHLQHATPHQLLDLKLISPDVWQQYFKFTFIRNPWDKAYSDYYWMMNDRQVNDSFENYISASGKFEKYLSIPNNCEYRGDHLMKQNQFLKCPGNEKYNFIGQFENLTADVEKIRKILGIKPLFDKHYQKGTKEFSHYSKFYDEKRKKLIEENYQEDIDSLGYVFEEKKHFLDIIKKKLGFSKLWN